MKVTLFGAKAQELTELFEHESELELVDTDPDVIVCFGGDGTLLASELRWPGLPKVPIRNSRRGIRCIAEPAPEVVQKLAAGALVRTEHMKLECSVVHSDEEEGESLLQAINEFSVHMGRTNSSVRFKVWFDGKPYGDDHEIIGDGFVVSTPFGSTAYFNQITRGVFWEGIGIAFKYTGDHTNHLIVPEDTTIRAKITRGPAVLAYDNSLEYVSLSEGDVLTVRKSEQSAVLLTTDG